MTDKEKMLLEYLYTQAQNLEQFMERNGLTDLYESASMSIHPNSEVKLYEKPSIKYTLLWADCRGKDGKLYTRHYNPYEKKSTLSEY